METTQSSIVHSSQVIDEAGSLTFGETLPFDMGMSQLSEAGKDTIILADGRLIKLTGTDEDIQLIAADRNMRLKQTLIHLYLSGLNLVKVRDYFIDAYGSPKEFWQKMFDLTGYSRSKLESEIRISQGFTLQEIESLADVGATQSVAIRLLKASPAKKEEVIAQAEQGRLITNAVVTEIIETNEEDDDIVSNKEYQSQVTAIEEEISTKYGKVIPQNYVEVPATVTYEEIATEDYASSIKLLEQRLQSLLNAIEVGRNKSFAIRGQSIREEQAIVLAEFYNIKLPIREPQENEPVWVTEARKLLPKGVAQKFTPLYIMALVDGYLGYIRNQEGKPKIYEVFPKYLSKDAGEACNNIFDVGFAQAKLEAEAK